MRRKTIFALLCCLPAAPLLAQTTIGGGTCTSSTVSGAYAVQLTGRQVTTAGTFTNVFEAVGSATFDGQSKVTVALTQDTTSAAGTPLNWSGTYSVQANCAGSMTITSGGSATFNLALYNTGSNFLMTGNDATYAYSGAGDSQPTTCSTALLNGVYTITGTGYSLKSGGVVGAAALSGLIDFDGQGHVTANAAIGGSAVGSPITGSYSLSSNCVGSATLTGTAGTYAMGFSVFTANSTAVTAFYLNLAVGGAIMINGNAHAAYGQPSASAEDFRRQKRDRAGPAFAKLISRDGDRGARS